MAVSDITDVFISRKKEDAPLAKELYYYLTGIGLKVFESDEELSKRGNSNYRKEIDKVLAECKHLIVVASSVKNINSDWVEAEWGFFINAKRAGDKKGNILAVVTSDVNRKELPPSLRYYETIDFDRRNFARIASYLNNEAGSSSNNNESQQTSFDTYTRKKNPHFGKPLFTQVSQTNIRHICSLPAGFLNPANTLPELANPVDSLAYDYYGKHLSTFSQRTGKTIIWNVRNGDPIQSLNIPGVKNAFFDRGGHLIAWTENNEIIEFDDVKNSNSDLYDIEWKIKRTEKIKGIEKLKSPVICQVVEDGNFIPSTRAILIKEKDHLNQPYYRGYSLVIIQKIESFGESEFHELLFVKEDIQRIKCIGTEVFISFTPQRIYFNNAGKDMAAIKDVAFVSAGMVNEIFCISDYFSYAYTGYSMNEYAKGIIPSKQETGKLILNGRYNIMEGGYNRVRSYEHRWLIALANHNEVSIINPPGDKRQILKAQSEEIIKMSWGGNLGTSSYPLPTNAAQFLLSWKQRKESYSSAFLTTAARDGAIRVWHAETAKEVACFQNTPVHMPVFDWTDANQFAYSDRDGFVHVFDILFKP